jgi:hypothetical protein
MDIQSLLQIDLLLQVRGITPGRAAALVPGVLGLLSVATGWWALARSTARIDRRRFATIVSLILALTGIILSAAHLTRATGDFGTGSGKLGAIVALVLGLAGLVLSGIALTRIRRMATGSNTAR